MIIFLEQIQIEKTSCKCCSSKAVLYDVCDFSKNCEEKNGKFLPLTGIPIYYYKCSSCGFIFTAKFDKFKKDEFKRYIYNDDYLEIDPDYADERPKNNARIIADMFYRQKDTISILDYGGGTGVFENNLKKKGFSEVITYDPFCEKYAARPEERFNLVVSFEVVEHTVDPYDTFKDMMSFLDVDDGLMLFSTLVQPSYIDKIKTSWWYISPRNGHISIHSRDSLNAVLNRLGLHHAFANRTLHIAFRNKTDFSKHLFNN